jgi:DNA-directed RNA polymerase sigma subunit (sigma70/sigma32)
MSRSLAWISDDRWPSDEGWPYPDGDAAESFCEELVDVDTLTDDDLVSLHAAGGHLLECLNPVERQVVTGRYGLDGAPPRSMRELQQDLGLPRAELRLALGGALTKLRTRVG